MEGNIFTHVTSGLNHVLAHLLLLLLLLLLLFLSPPPALLLLLLLSPISLGVLS
jgi:hypothetical protein